MSSSVLSAETQATASHVFDDVRGFIAASQELEDNWREILDADWDLEIGALTEAAAELIPEPPMLIFDRVKGYPSGYRVVSLPLASYKRAALALGLPIDRSRMDLVRMAARKVQSARLIPPAVVSSGPVLENVHNGDSIDVLRFPVPRFHQEDGGRTSARATSSSIATWTPAMSTWVPTESRCTVRSCSDCG